MSAEPTLTPMANADGTSEEAESGVFPQVYGQYLLLHRLARGGMGNVFLAKTGGMMGIEKHCVVKTLRARFTHDAEYVQRFMEEARVVVQLSHRNICPVFDVGRVGQSYYLAMELVIGRDVRRLTTALEDLGRNLPESVALHIACEMLDALDYAHRHVDNTTGHPLHLVHRDISPQNVMINIEGEVKLIDFGLAESGREISNEPQTSGATTVMGKMSYMAPEQARGEVVDARADQFAAAVVAYELLVGQRYYEGLSQQQIWAQAGAGQFKPAGLTRLEPELRKVLMTALAPNKEDRYASSGDFREALLAYVRRKNLHAGARDLRALMNELLVDELRETRELLQRFAHVSTVRRPGFSNPDETVDLVSPTDVFSIATSHAKTIHDPTEMFRASPATYVGPERGKSWALPAMIASAGLLAVGAGAVLLWLATRAPVNDTVAAQPALPVVVEPAPPPVPPAPVVAEPSPTEVKPPVVEDKPEEPEPREATSTRRSSTRRSEKRASPPPAPAALTWKDQLNYVRNRCASATCTKEANARYAKLVTLSPSETQVFRDSLKRCYDACRK